jgi:transitional endoplasmic reticulum ATPase
MAPQPLPADVMKAIASILVTDAIMAGGPVYTADVVRVGDKIILPEGANLPQIIEVLQRQNKSEQQMTEIHSTIAVPPWDGAYALVKAIDEVIGVTVQKPSMDGNAHQIDVEVERGKVVQVPWGSFELPGMDNASISTDTTWEEGRLVFQVHVECKRLYADRVRRLLDRVREIATAESLHRGKAFTMTFRDDRGRQLPMPMPKFFEFSDEEPIFSQDLQARIDRNVIVPIAQTENCRIIGEKLKRGVLFAGKYGVGKTLLASYIAKIAVANGWTFIYVKNSNELNEALSFAQHYQPVVVFAEDVDRVAGEDRDEAVNKLLNQLDGIDGKNAEILTILTSNHADEINAAMRRPGRIDVVLEVEPPDAEAVSRMIHRFAGERLDAKTDLSAASAALAGQIPAVVREVVSRSKLEMLRRTGTATGKITGPDILTVATEVSAENDLFRTKTRKDGLNFEAMAEIFTAAGTAMEEAAENHSVN